MGNRRFFIGGNRNSSSHFNHVHRYVYDRFMQQLHSVFHPGEAESCQGGAGP